MQPLNTLPPMEPEIAEPVKKRLDVGPSFVELMKEANQGKMMLLQLPSSMAHFSHEAMKKFATGDYNEEVGIEDPPIEKAVKLEIKQEIEDTKPEVKKRVLPTLRGSLVKAPPKKTEEPEKIVKPVKHCLEECPTEVEIGKIQLMQSGNVIMNIGGHVLNVTPAIRSESHEAIASIETPSGPYRMTEGNMKIFGSISANNSFICTYF